MMESFSLVTVLAILFAAGIGGLTLAQWWSALGSSATMPCPIRRDSLKRSDRHTAMPRLGAASTKTKGRQSARRAIRESGRPAGGGARGCAFEEILRELHRLGFFPETSLVSAVAHSMLAVPAPRSPPS